MQGAHRELGATKLSLDIDGYAVEEELRKKQNARVGAGQVMREQTPVLWTRTHEVSLMGGSGKMHTPGDVARDAGQAAHADGHEKQTGRMG